MRLPQMTELPATRSMTEEFRGLNKALRIGAGEFADMENLTAEYYPLLSPRGQRGVYKDDGSYASPYLAIHAKDRLCWIKGTSVYVNGYEVTGLTLSADAPKSMVSMGAHIIIFPDKVWVNTIRAENQPSFSFGNLEEPFESTGDITFSLCDLEGTEYTNLNPGSGVPNNPVNGTLWLDTSSSTFVLKKYSVENAEWVAIPYTYIKISTTGITGTSPDYNKFSVGDGVTISGVKNADLQDLNSTMVIQAKGEDYIVVTGIMNDTITQTSTDKIKVERKVPQMEYVIESGNRLWGCHYGLSADGTSVINEIYASKLGDFKNWSVFNGVSTDSYTASVGSDGAFTGAINYLGYPLFFKENCIHKVYGNYPANYQIQTTTARGVEKGSAGSLAIVNEILYYKSPFDFCAYDGSLPGTISTALDGWTLKNAIACGHNGSYYVSAQDQNGNRHFLVYDVKKGFWLREDDVRVTALESCDDDLFMIEEAYDADHDKYYGEKIISEFGSGVPDIAPIHWSAETGVIGLSLPDAKNVSRITVRLWLSPGSHVSFYAEYDSVSGWHHLCTLSQRFLRSFSVPLKPRRCDHLRLKVEGVGDCKVYSIAYTSEQGSEKP